MEAEAQVRWDIRIEGESFGPGDTVKLVGTFRSLAREPRRWTVHTLLERTDGEDLPIGIIPSTVALDPGQEREVVIREIPVTDDLDPGEYSLKAGLEVGRGVTHFQEVIFRIEGTPQPLDFRVRLLREKGGRNLRVLDAEDRVGHVQVESDVPDLELSGVLTNPQGEKVPLEFAERKASFPLAGEGPYTLEVNAAAEGYRPRTRKLVFGVARARSAFGRFDDLRRSRGRGPRKPR